MIQSVAFIATAFFCASLVEQRRIEVFRGEERVVGVHKKSENYTTYDGPIIVTALNPGAVNKWNEVRGPDGSYIIPYIITGNYSAGQSKIITRAMRAIERNTCVRFVQKHRLGRKQGYSFLDIVNKKNDGCYSNVGRDTFSERNVLALEESADASCIYYDIVLHEMLHTVGLYHEHNRMDRDKYIRIHYENMNYTYAKDFLKYPISDTYNTKYNYLSLMHYRQDAFANGENVATIEALDPKYQNVMGTAKDAAPSDYQQVCGLYRCRMCNGKPFNRRKARSKYRFLPQDFLSFLADLAAAIKHGL